MAHATAPIGLSFSLPADSECDDTIADAIADQHCPDALVLVAQIEHKERLHDAFRKLTAQERQAVWLCYLDDNEYTLKEIGQFMGLGAPRVSQICSGARKKLAAELCKHQEFASVGFVTNRTGDIFSTRQRPFGGSTTPTARVPVRTATGSSKWPVPRSLG